METNLSGRTIRRWAGRCVCFVSICGLPAAASAQNGSIVGRVLHENGTGIPGVSVVVAETATTTITEGDGQFSFRGLPAVARGQRDWTRTTPPPAGRSGRTSTPC